MMTITITEYRETSVLANVIMDICNDTEMTLDMLNGVFKYMVENYIEDLPMSESYTRKHYLKQLLKTLRTDGITILTTKDKNVTAELDTIGNDNEMPEKHHSDEHHSDEHHSDEHHSDEHHSDEHHSDEHHSVNVANSVESSILPVCLTNAPTSCGIDFNTFQYRELRPLCRLLGIKPQGTKQGLVDRLDKFKERKNCTKSIDQEDVDDDVHDMFIRLAMNEPDKNALMQSLENYVKNKTLNAPVGKKVKKPKPDNASPAKKSKQPKNVGNGEPNYAKMTVPALKAMCTSLGLVHKNGTKQVLIDKITAHLANEHDNSTDKQNDDDNNVENKVVDCDENEKPVSKLNRGAKAVPKQPKAPYDNNVENKVVDCDENEKPVSKLNRGAKAVPKQPKAPSKKKPKPVDEEANRAPTKKAKKPKKAVEPQRDEFVLVDDEYGNKVHEATGLVFNDDQVVIGFIDEDNHVRPLTTEKMDLCKEHRFKYEIPDNFDIDERYVDEY